MDELLNFVDADFVRPPSSKIARSSSLIVSLPNSTRLLSEWTLEGDEDFLYSKNSKYIYATKTGMILSKKKEEKRHLYVGAFPVWPHGRPPWLHVASLYLYLN